MTSETRISEIALGAADALRKYGWIQHSLGNPTDGMCIFGAIRYTTRHTTGKPRNDEMEEIWVKVMKILVTERPFQWNDTLGRTQEEVIALLEQVAGVEELRKAA